MSKKAKFFLATALWALFFVVIWTVISVIFMLISCSIKKVPMSFDAFFSMLLDIRCLIITILVFVICFAGFFIKLLQKPKSGVGAKRSKSNVHDSATFMSEEEINRNYGNKKLKDYKRFSNIENEDVNGMVINSIGKKGDILFNSASDLHSLTMGTTGMGKTKFLLIPTVELMARSKTKPSMVLLDVKGEIHEKTHKNLEEQGYETHLVDLRNPSKSEKFNPFSLVIYYWDEYLQNPRNIVAKEKTSDLILQICSMFNPKMKGVNGGGSGDAYWDNAAMSVMEAYIWSLLENYEYVAYRHRSPYDLYTETGVPTDSELVAQKMADISEKITGFGTRDGITFRALQDIANLDLKSYYMYLNNRPHDSRTYQAAHETIINMITKQNGNYEMQKPLLSLLSVYKTNYKRIITETIEAVSSSSSFDLKEMYSKDGSPFALYILMPDEDKNKYPFASLMISEIYQFFTSLSQEKGFHSSSERRIVHFFMDEFANLNPMEDIDNWLSVGRERKLFLHLFIQGLSQLNNKYGHDKAKTIIGNCNMKIFMALSENEAVDYAVRLFGTYTTTQTSTSASTNSRSSSSSTSNALGQANLINPSEIKQLPKGNIYFMETTKNPGKGKLLATFTKEMRQAFNYD